MKANPNVQTDSMVDNKELRQKYIDRTEVLDKLKNKLFLIPQLEMMTIQQVADFYEVDLKAIQQCVHRNSDEIYADGVVMKKPHDFGKITKLTSCQFPEVSKTANSTTYQIAENVTIVIPNRGVRCFSKRAVLRIGMLLRDSKVAQEVRTQLLNVVEHVESENPQILTQEIDNEQELLNNIVVAYTGGDPVKILQATSAHAAYLKRHNEKLKQENTELAEKNDTLAKDNDILSGNILEWSNRASANKIVRLMAMKLKWDFATTWSEIYNELLYKHSINLKARKTRDGRASLPLLAFLHDDEWKVLYQTIAAMLQARYVNPSKLFAEAKMIPETTEKNKPDELLDNIFGEGFSDFLRDHNK